MPSSLIWFRQDLRLADQPAVAAAAERGPTVGLYVLDDETPNDWSIGGAQRWWLHHSLEALGAELKKKGGTLLLRRGRSAEVVCAVMDELGAETVHAARHYEPWWRAAEAELGARLTLHEGDVLHEPEAFRNGSGGSFKIFGPYYRALSKDLPPPEPLPAPKRFNAPPELPRSDRLADWKLLPTRPNWATGFDVWSPGEAGAQDHLHRFAAEVETYAERRDLPSEVGTSNLSPHLHFGELSPRQLWHGLSDGADDKFRRELAWRDFSRHIILADPELGNREQRPLKLKHRRSDRDFAAWSRGRTGYPIVDAGMRQLWATGWMHNRVRLITASFLVKHLLLDWRLGAHWFWDTLVDADYANNSQNWQWIAGTGFDSQPFYRVMAPLLQSEKFAAADYIRRWVPELADLSDRDIHDPHARGLAPAGYPEPLIPHREARERALQAFRDARNR
ncbi:deoxyribodipyrimidine photo-lyase [Sphingomonas ginkgonis]|uniref:Deoxyribodipyrimidine photo-lyase n=1 Tax=Sphingomonas ginkgonis TaxID=2315330 RepID=A0A3R9YI23_9SPHN|nr:deoxyribodipyrimidine photo-lyase [Sphingomonas ginkgonis]RST30403.1 deoxyribodipyrimidine photo-lyase [Sphingomonas ginkgonis]